MHLMPLEEARALVLAALDGPLPAEEVPVEDALGRVVAADVVATTDLPPWDNSAMDGYAIRSTDVAAAGEGASIRLQVVGEVPAGGRSDALVAAGTAIRIATGAPVPSGADAIVPVELTTPLDAEGTPGPRGREAAGPLPAACLVHEPVQAGGSIRRRGDDLTRGTVVLSAGSSVTAPGVAVAAGSGNGRIPVHRRPVVGVLATGDEVRAAGEPLGPAGIPDANGPGIRALVRAAGGIPLDLGIAPDRLEDVLGTLRSALPLVDAIVVSGGVSVGPYDVVRLAFGDLGRVDLWRVAIQPGKPFAFGVATTATGGAAAGEAAAPADNRSAARAPDAASVRGGPSVRGVTLFGLPGNPVSSFVTFELFVRPALRALLGHRDVLRPTDRAVLLDRTTKSAGRRAFLRVVAERSAAGDVVRDERGRARIRLAGGQGSHVLSALAAADGLAVIPEALEAVEPGMEVELWWSDRP
jgi:molybdopterin molybdotransferase